MLSLMSSQVAVVSYLLLSIGASFFPVVAYCQDVTDDSTTTTKVNATDVASPGTMLHYLRGGATGFGHVSSLLQDDIAASQKSGGNHHDDAKVKVSVDKSILKDNNDSTNNKTVSALETTTTTMKKAWVTILTGDAFNTTMFVATQITSLNNKHLTTDYDHVTMVLPAVPEETRSYLRSLGSIVVEVPSIKPGENYKIPYRWYQYAFSKLNAWSLTDYDQILLMDADSYISNGHVLEEVFDLCQADFCAIKRKPDHEITQMQPQPWINGGVWILRPNKDRYDYITNERLSHGVVRPLYVEEGYISELAMEGTLGSHQFLDWRYNTCSQGYFDQMDDCRRRTYTPDMKHPHSMKFADCFNPVVDQAAVIHHCGNFRLSSDPLCLWNEQDQASGNAKQQSGAQNKDFTDDPRCHVNLFTGFEELMLQVNPCAVGGRSKQSCDALQLSDNDGESSSSKACQWCGYDVRCIPSSMSCNKNSADSKRVADRTALMNRDWEIRHASAGRKAKELRKKRDQRLLAKEQSFDECFDVCDICAAASTPHTPVAEKSPDCLECNTCICTSDALTPPPADVCKACDTDDPPDDETCHICLYFDKSEARTPPPPPYGCPDEEQKQGVDYGLDEQCFKYCDQCAISSDPHTPISEKSSVCSKCNECICSSDARTPPPEDVCDACVNGKDKDKPDAATCDVCAFYKDSQPRTPPPPPYGCEE